MNHKVLHGVEEVRREYLLQLAYGLYTIRLKIGDMVGRLFDSTNISEEKVKLSQKTPYEVGKEIMPSQWENH